MKFSFVLCFNFSSPKFCIFDITKNKKQINTFGSYSQVHELVYFKWVCWCCPFVLYNNRNENWMTGWLGTVKQWDSGCGFGALLFHSVVQRCNMFAATFQRLAQTQLIDYSFGDDCNRFSEGLVKVYLYHNYVVMMCLKPRNVNIKKTFSSLFKVVY